MIGTTRSRVSFFMNKFRKLGFIDYNGGSHVHSSASRSSTTTNFPYSLSSKPKASVKLPAPSILPN
jgi:hypothetical protein